MCVCVCVCVRMNYLLSHNNTIPTFLFPVVYNLEFDWIIIWNGQVAPSDVFGYNSFLSVDGVNAHHLVREMAITLCYRHLVANILTISRTHVWREKNRGGIYTQKSLMIAKRMRNLNNCKQIHFKISNILSINRNIITLLSELYV